MADLDEDPLFAETNAEDALVFPTPKTAASTAPNEADLSGDEDEQTQDYRFLIPAASKKDGHLLPRRGEKDFEPHGTNAQSSTLAASQAAMHAALSVERIHGPINAKNSNLIGYFNIETGLTLVHKEQGVFFRSMGHPVKGTSHGGCMLEPEEALFLCERGSMELRFGERESKRRGGSHAENGDVTPLDGIPMSLQSAYACCIGSRGLTLERYIVYAGLKRSGYTVFRAEGGWDDELPEESNQKTSQGEPKQTSLGAWFHGILVNMFANSLSSQQNAPLIGTSFFRDYRTIYTRLAIIPTYSATAIPKHKINKDSSNPALHPAFNAYKPSTPIKKTLLPPAEFRFVVMDARDTNFPTPTQISNLLNEITQMTIKETETYQSLLSKAESTATAKAKAKGKPVISPATGPSNPPTTTTATATPPVTTPRPATQASQIKPVGALYKSLKNGQPGQDIILAIVDSGLVSYIRIAAGSFAEDKVWERNPLVGNPSLVLNSAGSGKSGAANGGKDARGAARGRGRGQGQGRGGKKR